MEKITSKSNNSIKEVKKLFTSRRKRTEKRKFVLEGARLCFDVLNSDYQIDELMLTESVFEKYRPQCNMLMERAERSAFISEELAEKLGETESPQGIFVVCKMKEEMNSPEPGGKYIALDTLQDPSNLGAIIRTGEALGISGAVLYNCCDAFNPKALRASMGSILRMPLIFSSNLESDIEELKKQGFSCFAAVPDSSALDITKAEFPPSSVAVIGNEGNGISEEIISACSERITINMLGRAESLNASVAAAITMWEMLR